MTTDFLNDETFFENINLDGKQSKTPQNPETPKKSKTPRIKAAEKPKPTQKQNVEIQKPVRRSKIKREPLKVVNSDEKTQEVASKKSTVNEPPQERSTRKGPQTIPKVTVFPNDTTAIEDKKKPLAKVPKPGATERRSLPARKRTKNDEVDGEKIRHSLNDDKTRLLKTAPENKKSVPSTKNKLKEGTAKLQTVFPDADPEFLKVQLTRFKGSLKDTIEFLLTKEKENEVPKKRETEELHGLLLEKFKVEDFLLMFPDPWEYFTKTERERSPNYVEQCLYYLKNKYRKHYVQAIQDAFAKNQHSLYLADKELSKKNRLLKMRTTPRSKGECDASRPASFDVEFMHEVAFIENENQIKLHLKKVKIARNKKFKEAEKAENLLECLSCNNFTLLQDDAVNCPAHHVFCKDCLIKYVKIEIRNNNYQFKCLVKCEEAFPVESLQVALSPSVLVRILERNQAEEFKPEGIENLVSCPFCYNIFLVPPETTALRCVNPTCMMEYCRKCKRGNHLPWNCGEAKVMMEATLQMVEEEPENEEKEKGGIETDSSTCSGEILQREVSDHRLHFVCQQPLPEDPHTVDYPFKLSPWSLSFSSDGTEYAELEADKENSFTEHSSWNLEF